MLTRRRAFPSELSEAQVWDQICGRSQLPWEALSAPSNAFAAAGGQFRARAKGAVLECLHRDPERRPTAAALVQTLRALLAEQ